MPEGVGIFDKIGKFRNKKQEMKDRRGNRMKRKTEKQH